MDKLQQLQWQAEMGADEAVTDTPEKWDTPKATPQKTSVAKVTAPAEIATQAPTPKPKPMTSAASGVGEARTIAENCTTLEQLKDAVLNFDGLAIKKTATNTVFSDGVPDAEVMFIGEAPGAEEDKKGVPFCGASGQLLDTALATINLIRAENFYISNTIFWRPPGNRRPTPEELAICRPLVEKHIALINPKLLVLVGGTATTALLETDTGISRLRHTQHDYANNFLDRTIPTIALFHPSYLLRQPIKKRDFWHDLLRMKHFMQQHNIKPHST